MAQHTTETRIALIEKRQEDNEKLIEKLSQAIAAIQDLATSLNQVIKIHEIKIDHRVDAERELYEMMGKYQEKVDDRIATVERETEEATRRLEQKFDSMKTELQAAIKEGLTPITADAAEVRTELNKYRRLIWAIGGAAVVAALFFPGGFEIIKAILL